MALENDRKETWTEDMLDYYSSRCDEIKSDRINDHLDDMGGSGSVNEVEEETTGSARFVTQNEVSNVIDGSMAQLGGAFASHASSIQC